MPSGRKLFIPAGGGNALTRGAMPSLIGPIRQVLTEGADRFHTANDIDGARRCLIGVLWKLHDSLAPVAPDARLLLTAADPLSFALQSSRHWLVALPGDYVPQNAHADFHRQVINVQTAAVLQHFAYSRGAKPGQGGKIARKIAAALRRGRIGKPPAPRTIQEYRAKMLAKENEVLAEWFNKFLKQIADEKQGLRYWLNFLEKRCREMRRHLPQKKRRFAPPRSSDWVV